MMEMEANPRSGGVQRGRGSRAILFAFVLGSSSRFSTARIQIMGSAGSKTPFRLHPVHAPSNCGSGPSQIFPALSLTINTLSHFVDKMLRHEQIQRLVAGFVPFIMSKICT